MKKQVKRYAAVYSLYIHAENDQEAKKEADEEQWMLERLKDCNSKKN